MNTLHKQEGHTCVDNSIVPCSACVAAQPVLHPENGYYRPTTVLTCVFCSQTLKRLSDGVLVDDNGATFCCAMFLSDVPMLHRARV